MAEIIAIGAPWRYKPEWCDQCHYLERSEPFSDDPKDVMVACDAPSGICIVDGFKIYPRLSEERS